MAHRLTKPKNISKMDADVIIGRVHRMVERKSELIKSGEVISCNVRISPGNIKTGNIPSVSLIPIADCPNCKECKRMCYDVRNDCSMLRKGTMDSRAINSAILQYDIVRYFNSINAYIKYNMPRAFRWHIGGDIKDENYLQAMVQIAKENINVKFWAFTKNYDVVNGYLSDGHTLPDNLSIVFSVWPGMECCNPYNLPTAHVIFDKRTASKYGYQDITTAPAGAMWCPGDCTECFYEKKGCMNLKQGEAIVMPAH